ncbi:MAG: DUF177 domain-containing protein [Bacteroidia bacterium]|nr:DUF177 domain-containing protein [Bacteroidia bacterium]MBP9688343.1 DUF177 domain-containing protein [Bacteroidia bacterium]
MGAKAKDYFIEFNKLAIGSNFFEFVLDNAFFASVEGGEFSNANAVVKLALIKSENMYDLQFNLTGVVGTTCDNCLNEISIPLKNEFHLLMKISENEDYGDDEIIYITKKILEYDLTQYLYESFVLSIPTRKVCEMTNKKCNQELATKINNFESEDYGDGSNPMWDKLKGIF